jgi:hypothetical protein
MENKALFEWPPMQNPKVSQYDKYALYSIMVRTKKKGDLLSAFMFDECRETHPVGEE